MTKKQRRAYNRLWMRAHRRGEANKRGKTATILGIRVFVAPKRTGYTVYRMSQ